MKDGRYREYLRRTGIDLDIFRLGQSFWPEDDLKPELPTDLVDTWSIHPIPEPMWRGRSGGLPLEGSFLFGSFRSAPDASGDFILIKGMNGASRNPYHTFVILELRLDGQTVLEGYLNQVLIRADGMVEPEVAMDAALRYRDVVGGSAVVVGEVPGAAFCTWRRTLVQRVGRYVLAVDDLAFRADSEDMEVGVLWQGKGAWEALPDGGAVRVAGAGEIRLCDPVETAVGDGQARMAWRGTVQQGSERRFFSLIAAEGTVCARLAENAAVLALPEPAVAAVGAYEGLQAELVVLARDHLHGVNATEVALGASLLSASAPVQVDWDFHSGALVKRLPVFWGPGSRFALIDGPGGSVNLLIARQPTDSHAMAVVNNREMDPKQRSFRDVPAGHTNIGGWACMSRKHIFYEDLDGDGKMEVVSEINGTWNRVTVWADDGTALYNVHLGPGQRIPADNVRDFDIADLDGDGKKELLVAISGGLVLALNHRCEKVWARRLPSPPAVMAWVEAAGACRVVAGCEDGTLVVLDGGGEVVRSGRITGRPTCIVRVDGDVVLATDEGEVKGWRVGDRW